MPLVKILGIDNMGRFLLNAFAFLESESEGNYLAVVHKVNSLYKKGVFSAIMGTYFELALINPLGVTFPATRIKWSLCFCVSVCQ